MAKATTRLRRAAARALAIAALAACAASCGPRNKYKVEGVVDGNPTMNLYVKYYANGALTDGVTPVQDGKFSFAGLLDGPALMVISDENAVIGRLYVKPGDKLSLRIDRSNPYKLAVTGSEENEEWASAASAMAGELAEPGAKANAAIEAYAAKHPGTIPSAMLYLAAYDMSVDPLRADSVMRSIATGTETQQLLASCFTVMDRFSNPDMMAKIDTLRFRTRERDTAYVFTPSKPATLIAFSSERMQREDSIMPRLRELKGRKRLEIIDISLTPDTTLWKSITRLDSATWTQGWAPGGIFARGIDRLALPGLPYWIVVDSAGRQVYRGAGFEGAQQAIDKLSKDK